MDYKEQKMNIRGVDINYLKVGTGEHPVLLLPGTLGSIWKSFKPHIENLDRNRFTIIAWDPPGYGKSRPAPTRDFSDGFLQRDATIANDLMKTLGYETFSMIGRCSGGTTACVLAAMYPNSVRNMITIATRAYISPEELLVYKDRLSWDNWPEPEITALCNLYGEEYVRSVCSAWVNSLIDRSKNQNGNLCMELLDKIQCPTLIVHGVGDPLVAGIHPFVLRDKILHSSVYIFEGGEHAPNLKYPEEFNDLATNFLLNPSSVEDRAPTSAT